MLQKKKFQIQDESGDKKYFTIIPNYILNHSTLWDREVYIQMKRIAGENGNCWMSEDNLSKQCGISKWKIRKSLKYLIENKWVICIGKKPSNKFDTEGTKIYKVIDLWELNNKFYQDKKAMASYATAPLKGDGVIPQKAMASYATKEEPRNNIYIPLTADSVQKIQKTIKEKNTNPNVKVIIDWFVSYVEKCDGVRPEISGAKDGAAVKNALNKYSVEEVKDIVDTYLASEKVKKFGYNLSTALSVDTINKWLYEEKRLR